MPGAIGIVEPQRPLSPSCGKVTVSANSATVTVSWTEYPPVGGYGSPRRRQLCLPKAVWDKAKTL